MRLWPSKNVTERKNDQECEDECRRSADIRGVDSQPAIQSLGGCLVLNDERVGGGIERRVSSATAARECQFYNWFREFWDLEGVRYYARILVEIIERILRHVGVRDQRTLPPQKDCSAKVFHMRAECAARCALPLGDSRIRDHCDHAAHDLW